MTWREIYKFISRPLVWLEDALFPRRCLGCGRWDEWCCAGCLAKLEFKRELACPGCGQGSALGAFCEKCKALSNHTSTISSLDNKSAAPRPLASIQNNGVGRPGQWLDGLWPVQPYGQPLIKRLIHDFKYDYLTDLGDILAGLMLAAMQTYQLPPAWHSQPRHKWQLVPVPLAGRRLRERGFNQAAYLAEKISQNIGLKVSDIITRSHTTQPQSKIADPIKRRQNLLNVFRLKPNVNCVGQVYILVDDVYTSGATMSECARVLKQAGASEVWGLAAAKG